MYNLYGNYELEQDIEFIEAQVLVNSYREQTKTILNKMESLYSESFGGFVGYLFGVLAKAVGAFMAKLLVVLKKVLVVVFTSVVVAIARKVSEGRGSSVVGGGGGGNPNLGQPTITADNIRTVTEKGFTKKDASRMRSMIKKGFTPVKIPGLKVDELTKSGIKDVSLMVRTFIEEHREELVPVEMAMRSNVDPVSPLTFVIEEPALIELIVASINEDIDSGNYVMKDIDAGLGGNRTFNFLREEGYKTLLNTLRVMGVANVDNSDNVAEVLVKMLATALDAFAVCEINVKETLALITDGINSTMIVDCKEYFERLKSKIDDIDKYGAFNRIKKDMTMMESSGRYTELGMLDIIFKDQKVMLEKVGFPVDISKCKTIDEANSKLSTIANGLHKASEQFDRFTTIKDIRLEIEDLTNSVSHTVVRVKMLPKVNPKNYVNSEELAHQMMYKFLKSKEAKDNSPNIIAQKSKALEKGIKEINDTLNKVDLQFEEKKNFTSRLQDSCTMTNNLSSILSNVTHLIGLLGVYKVGVSAHVIKDIIENRANVLVALQLEEIMEKL